MSIFKNLNSNVSPLYTLRNRNRTGSNVGSMLGGDKLSFMRNGGLGRFYYDTLTNNVDKILQTVASDLRGISQSTVSLIIKKISESLVEKMRNAVKFPEFLFHYQDFMNEFNQIANFPGVSSCVDGTHIPIKNPGGAVDIVNNKTESRGSVRGRGLKLATRMRTLGVTENDIVVISTNRNANQTVVLLATLLLGATLAPLDINLCYDEALRLIKKLKPRIIFVELRGCSQMVRVLDDINHKAIIVDLNNSKQPTHIAFSDMFYQKDDIEMEPIHIDDPHKKTALIFATQGTHGSIKLVCWSQLNVYVQTVILSFTIELPGKLLSLFPFCWFLQVVLVCASFEHVVTMIIPGAFTEKTLCKYIQDFDVSTLILSTDQAMRLVTSIFVKDYNMTNLKTVLIGTTHIQTQQWLKLRSTLPDVLFLTCYGLTETGVVATTDTRNYTEWLEKPGTVGKLTYNTKVRIIDQNTRRALGVNNVGEIYYKGDGLMLGYFKNNEKTQANIEKGYFRTGDIGMYDDDGWLYFKGRKEDQISFSGFPDFLSTELEDIILSHPLVQTVAIIGNQKELIVLYVEVPNEDLPAATLQEFISKNFHDKPLPTKLIKLNELPTTTLGNIKREALRQTYLERKLKYVESLASINDIPA